MLVIGNASHKWFWLLDFIPFQLVEIKKQEFYSLSSSGSFVELNKNEKLETVNANLNISSLDWEFKKRWEFYYLGNKISAKMKDDAFSDRIDKGERFAKGDTLEVEMEIRLEFDESVNAYVNKGYTVTRIIKHIERLPQGRLGFNDGIEKTTD